MDTNTNSENNYKSFLKKLYPTSQLKPKSITQVIKLPRFNEKLKECEQHFSASFDSFEYALQQEIILLRLQQIVNIQQLNPLWKQRFKDFNIKEAPQNFEDWQKLPVTDKHTAIDFFSGDRKGMVVPLEHGGFEIVASGGTSSGKPSGTRFARIPNSCDAGIWANQPLAFNEADFVFFSKRLSPDQHSVLSTEYSLGSCLQTTSPMLLRQIQNKLHDLEIHLSTCSYI